MARSSMGSRSAAETTTRVFPNLRQDGSPGNVDLSEEIHSGSLTLVPRSSVEPAGTTGSRPLVVQQVAQDFNLAVFGAEAALVPKPMPKTMPKPKDVFGAEAYAKRFAAKHARQQHGSSVWQQQASADPVPQLLDKNNTNTTNNNNKKPVPRRFDDDDADVSEGEQNQRLADAVLEDTRQFRQDMMVELKQHKKRNRGVANAGEHSRQIDKEEDSKEKNPRLADKEPHVERLKELDATLEELRKQNDELREKLSQAEKKVALQAKEEEEGRKQHEDELQQQAFETSQEHNHELERLHREYQAQLKSLENNFNMKAARAATAAHASLHEEKRRLHLRSKVDAKHMAEKEMAERTLAFQRRLTAERASRMAAEEQRQEAENQVTRLLEERATQATQAMNQHTLRAASDEEAAEEVASLEDEVPAQTSADGGPAQMSAPLSEGLVDTEMAAMDPSLPVDDSMLHYELHTETQPDKEEVEQVYNEMKATIGPEQEPPAAPNNVDSDSGCGRLQLVLFLDSHERQQALPPVLALQDATTEQLCFPVQGQDPRLTVPFWGIYCKAVRASRAAPDGDQVRPKEGELEKIKEEFLRQVQAAKAEGGVPWHYLESLQNESETTLCGIWPAWIAAARDMARPEQEACFSSSSSSSSSSLPPGELLQTEEHKLAKLNQIRNIREMSNKGNYDGEIKNALRRYEHEKLKLSELADDETRSGPVRARALWILEQLRKDEKDEKKDKQKQKKEEQRAKQGEHEERRGEPRQQESAQQPSSASSQSHLTQAEVVREFYGQECRVRTLTSDVYDLANRGYPQLLRPVHDFVQRWTYNRQVWQQGGIQEHQWIYFIQNMAGHRHSLQHFEVEVAKCRAACMMWARNARAQQAHYAGGAHAGGFWNQWSSTSSGR